MAELIIFEETIDEEETQEFKGSADILIANGLEERIHITIGPITITEQNSRKKKFALGFGIIDGLNMEVSCGASNVSTSVMKEQTFSVGPHNVHLLPSPEDSLSLTKPGKSSIKGNTLSLLIHKGADSSGEEIGKCVLGTGHGIIVSNLTGRCETSQMYGRSWYRKTDPWRTNMGVDLNPHQNVMKRQTCKVCLFKKLK
eukprot:GFUD01104061.1.p1 GENE.GFUD01104061.1~~GFUD01104061.1.p1  ORF type:complete len:199 (+),score=32.98 GFUD01104061.1:43-639(+)